MHEHPRVRTEQGLLEGRLRRGNADFRGISYAQPPVGALRFAVPAPVASWDGVRHAVEFGPAPPQSGPGPQADPSQDPDWLTLNVCTPDPGTTGLPVLVWLCCGGYMAGTAADPMTDPTALADAGIVVVSVQCRMGAEGFALLDGAPSNRGLLDQIAALEWVQHNIANFGGDPSRVTVAGVSGGAGSVAALLAVPRACSLFHRAITHSVPGLYCTPALAEEVTATLAHRLGVTPTAQALSTVTPQRLADEVTALCLDAPSYRERWGRLAHLGIVVCPVIDGELLGDTPWAALAEGRAEGIDLLVGHTRDEFRLFSIMMGVRGTFTDNDACTAMEVFAPRPDGPGAYRLAFPDAGPEELVEIVYSDATFRMPSLLLAEANTEAGGNSFLFELAYATGHFGACHSIDVPLAFATLDSPTGRLFFGDHPTADALAVSHELHQAWVRFITEGEPGWPRYSTDQRATRVLAAPSTTTTYPEETSRRIWLGRPPVPFTLLDDSRL
ncbi:carboxylesterase/lipase family protein [Mycolicibacterium wolinskyi]|uniref:Carboxylic ester hydrolase n=1 Tax=Mycolicibacterium wolinskyi TaxID=59750 RepID=A0A1X2FFH4_9MYCO|nr:MULTISPECIES: carboxylesterase family protein [Mycolicibacterium]MCV7290746.1 carboxylesterase/lipase family protein [Mycolicibacterium wolinskyi]MCV7291201.1 carboxylesterase/lipase family protein [Mycolicibacterium goodii]ORX17174.1 carboxylesterase [Mycolicibacterium wolinskyi]